MRKFFGSLARVSDFQIGLGIFGIALAIRLAVLLQLAGSPLFSVLAGDSRFFDEWARQIAGGDWIGRDVFFQAPLYPYFLALLYKSWGFSPWGPRLLQAALGALACLLLWQAGRRFFGRGAGLAAGLGMAFYAPAVFYELLIHKPGLLAVLLAAALRLLAAFGESRRRGTLALALGVVITLASFIQEHLLLCLPLAALWLALAGNGTAGPRRRAAWIGLLCLGAAAVLMPVALRNYSVGGVFLPTTSNGGVNFYIGNGPGADGSYQPLVGGRGDARYELEDARRLASRAVGRALSDTETSRYWLGLTIDHIQAHPLQWLGLMVRKLGMVLANHEWVDVDGLDAYADQSSLLGALGRVFRFAPLAALAVYGAWFACHDRRAGRHLLLAPVALAAGIALFFVFGRYRYALVPFLMLFAGYGAVVLGQRRFSAPAAGLAAVFLAVAFIPYKQMAREANVNYYVVGIEALNQERWGEAEKMLQVVRQREPDNGNPPFALAYIAKQRRDWDGAVALLRETLRAEPGRREAYGALGEALLMQGDALQAAGRLPEAESTLAGVARMELAHPGHRAAALLLMAEMRLLCEEMANPVLARTFREQALALWPQGRSGLPDRAALSIALLEGADGRMDGARRELDALAARNPDPDPDLRRAIARAQEAMADREVKTVGCRRG